MGMHTRAYTRVHVQAYSRENVGKTTEARTSGTKVKKTRADSAFKRAAAVKRGPSARYHPRCLIFVSTPREREGGGVGGRRGNHLEPPDQGSETIRARRAVQRAAAE